MQYIVVFATIWGYKNGGINAFNIDFCTALGKYLSQQQIPRTLICFSLEDPMGNDLKAANSSKIQIESLQCKESDDFRSQFTEIKRRLVELTLDTDQLLFVGHDVHSGFISNQLKDDFKGSASIIFHHMDYPAYVAIKDIDPDKLQNKIEQQDKVLGNASLVIGIGPKLTESARSKTIKPVEELIPGLQEVKDWPHRLTKFTAITFGRYDAVTDNLKQMQLAAKAFANFVINYPDDAGQDPTLNATGISSTKEALAYKKAALNSKQRYINIVAQPFNSTNRNKLFEDLSKNSVCLVLSMHEGFGLTGLEAIAAGVPLILSKNTGLYNWLISMYSTNELLGLGVIAVNIDATNDGTINKADIKLISKSLKDFRANQSNFQDGVRRLKKKLLTNFTWNDTAIRFIELINEYFIGDRILSEEPVLSASKVSDDSSIPFKIKINTIIGPSYTAFIGRKKEVEKALSIIKTTTSNQLLIHGAAGAGKTSLAIYLADQLMKDEAQDARKFGAYLWIPARTFVISSDAIRSEKGCSTLPDILTKIAIPLGLSEILRNPINEQEALIIQALNNIKALLIFDNFEDVDDQRVLNFIKQICRENFVIVTSRDDFPEITPRRHLKNLLKEDSLDLIDYEAATKNILLSKNQRIKVHQLAGGIPLAIRWCMVNLESAGDIDTSLNILQTESGTLLEFCFKEAIEKVDEVGKNILIACSLFPETATYKQLKEVNAATNDILFEKAIKLLRNKSLIEMSKDRFYILPLTKRLIVEQLIIDNSYFHGCESRLFDSFMNYLQSTATVVWTTGVKSMIWYDEAENIIETIDAFKEKKYFKRVLDLTIHIYPFILLYGQWDYYRQLCLYCLSIPGIGFAERIQILSRMTAIIVHSQDYENSVPYVDELDHCLTDILKLPYEDINMYHFVKTVFAVNALSDSASEQINEYIEYERTNGKEWALVGFMGWRGILECKQRKFDEALQTISKAIEIAKGLQLYRSLTFLYPTYLQAFNNAVKDQKRLAYPLDEMLTLATDFSELHNLAHLYKEIGILYITSGDSRGSEYLANASGIYQQMGLTRLANDCQQLLKV
jgi:glycosyltransferase involved in cell wall biosynthesis/AAA+ ATPase superfamily predicted ATPase